MKITERNHPFLKMLREKNIGDSKMYYAPEVSNKFTELADEYNKKICFVSKEFVEATEKSKRKLFKEELLNELGEGYYTIVALGVTVCVKYNISKENDWVTAYVIKGDRLLMYYDCSIFTNMSYVLPRHINKEELAKDKEELDAYLYSLLANTLSCILFIKYAEIESVEVKSNKKIIIDKEKTVNDSSSNIHFIDCRWFTELIRSEGFLVSGHFRLQPYKDGKKLIWINEFVKEGYTSRARKTIHEL